MNTARRSPAQLAVDWALGTLACFVLLVLMAWMDCKKAETAALRQSTSVSTDRTAAHATTRGTR